MQKTMMDYINEQPEVLDALLGNRKTHTAPFVEQWRAQRPDRLYLVASGSSYNAALAAAPFMQCLLGVEVSVHPPSRPPRLFGHRPLVLFVSQGGTSANTIAAAEALGGTAMLAVTAAESCRLNEVCGASLRIPCGMEVVGPKTKGYTTTLLLLCLMALEAAFGAGSLGGKVYDKMVEAYNCMVQAMPGNIARTLAWYECNGAALQGIRKCVVVGKGTGADAAGEGALKLLETLLVPAAGYEFEEYLHGPNCALDKGYAGIYFLPPEEDADTGRMLAMAGLHRGFCPTVYTVGGKKSGDARDLALDVTGKAYTAVFEWLLPCQVMGALLPATMGHEGKGHKLFLEIDAALGVKYRGS